MDESGLVGDSGSIEPDWPLADSTQVRLYYVGQDDEELGAVAAYAASAYDSITLVTDTDAVSGIETVRYWPFDCLVVESDDLTEDWVTLIDAASCPVVLYTDENRNETETDVLEMVETVVGKETEGKRPLFANIVGIARSPDRSNRGTVTETIQSLESDTRHTTGCFLVDSNGRIQWSNASLGELFREECRSRRDRRATHFYRRLAAITEGGPESALDLTSMLKHDRRRHGKVIQAPVGDATQYFLHASYPVLDGERGMRFEMITPVSSVVDSYDRIRLFEELADNAVDGLFALDANGYIEYCNRSYASMAGYERGELVGSHVSKTMAPGEVERAQRVLRDIMDSERESDTIDLTIETAEGDYVDTSYHFKPRDTADGEYAGLIGVVRDITERKARERELEEYRTLVESAGDPMFAVDERGHIEVLNEALVEFTGLSREELDGRHTSHILSEDCIERGKAALRDILADADRRWESFDTWLTDATGEERLCEVTVGAVVKNGEYAGSVATFRDITERHQKQQRIELLKQVFARSLRHNIRNKASVIEGFATVIADRTDEVDDDMIERIQRAGQSLARTSEKVSDLDFIANGDLDVVTHDLSAVFTDCLSAIDDRHASGDVTVDLPDGVSVRGIRDLDVAFRNLVENALEHGRNDGQASVTISATAMGDETITLTVADDGPGIPEQEVAVLERNEETALEHGSGLGLWLVDQVVQQSGGDLSFDVDDGTRAHVTLERADGG